MIHVKQTRLYDGSDPTAEPYRGNCYAACVASVFEVLLDRLPELHGTQDSGLTEWLSVHYPGVAVRSREFPPFDADETWPADLYPPMGFWLATVESPRYQEVCLRHTSSGGEAHPPHWYDLADCPFCGGSGMRQGLHLVVAKGRDVAHDPHPSVGGYGWEYNGRLCGMTTFVVTDPARLIPRARP